MSHTIELRKVSKYYADEATVSMGISRVDLDLDIGEFVAVTGESGSGKSTLLNVISGLDTYEEGEMFVCGEDTSAYGTEDYEKYRKIYIGNIFQDFNLINSYTVYQNIEVVMLLSGKKKKDCRETVNELIEQVGLSEYRNTRVSKLSGGQKQRVAIARALAKNAPVIVADEPTGNLDSASAKAIMETLAKVSRDKLVIIVTHNYEQAEPYVTRKITMHDGSIIEDKRIDPADKAAELSIDNLYDRLREEAFIQEQKTSNGDAVPATKDVQVHSSEYLAYGKMKRSSEVRLGVRNTFNLPTKFILLFLVYFLVCTAVLGQYASEKNRMHETSMLGSNPCFLNRSAERIIVKKADESSFTNNDFARIKDIPNINDVVKNDIALDSGVSVVFGDFTIEGPLVSIDHIKEKITYGHMPRNDYEIVIRVDAAADAFVSLANNGGDYIDKPVAVMDMNQIQTYDFGKEIRIAGIILDMNTDKDSGYSLYGYSTIYASDTVSNELLVSLMAAVSKAELYFGNTKVVNDEGHAVYPSSSVPDGKVFIFEDQLYYYEDAEALEKTLEKSSEEPVKKTSDEAKEKPSDKTQDGNFGLKIRNRFFESEGLFEVDKIITSKNCTKLVGIPKDEYSTYYNCVFISNNDFKELFDKGYYQISVFMINEQESDETKLALSENGFTTLAIKEALTDYTKGLGGMLDLMSYGRLLLEIIILFLVAYAVIRLIMRSRNSYYSTLRMLGASKNNITNILRTELMLMMLVAYGVDILFAVLVNRGVIQDLTGFEMKEASKLLYYLNPLDYSILGAVLLIMTLLISGTYSRHIFAKSAMKSFREGA